MSYPSFSSGFARSLILATVAFGLLVFLILPTGIIALNDDFGYLRSVVLTLQHGRPWTDDWLEPWGAGFSVLAAALFQASGSFHFATYGLLGVLAALSFYLLARILAARGLPALTALTVAMLGLTTPTILWKSLEFTGMALYLPCLLAALWSAENRRWGWFFLVWSLALSTRQSALSWAILPVAAVFEDFLTKRRATPVAVWWSPFCVIAGGVGLFCMLGKFMNKTHAQRMITDQMWQGWSLLQARGTFFTGGVIMLLAAGLGAAVLQIFGDRVAPRRSRGLVFTLAAIAVGIGLLFIKPADHIGFDHAALDGRMGAVYLNILLALAVAGWALISWSIRPVAAAGALGSLAVLCIRNVVWDYYLLDLACFGFFAVRLPQTVAGELPSARRIGRVIPRAALMVVIGTFHLLFVLHFKVYFDRGYAMGILGVRALQGGLVPADEGAFLPFGLMGWYYYPNYIEHDGAKSADLADFGRYLKHDTIGYANGFPKILHRIPEFRQNAPRDRSGVITSDLFPFCWVFHAEYLLMHSSPESAQPAKSALPKDFQLPIFPVDDAGWRRLIRGAD